MLRRREMRSRVVGGMQKRGRVAKHLACPWPVGDLKLQVGDGASLWCVVRWPVLESCQRKSCEDGRRPDQCRWSEFETDSRLTASPRGRSTCWTLSTLSSRVRYRASKENNRTWTMERGTCGIGRLHDLDGLCWERQRGNAQVAEG